MYSSSSKNHFSHFSGSSSKKKMQPRQMLIHEC
jgi:hypothetical protein